MYYIVPSLDVVPKLRVPLYRRCQSSREPPSGFARCHNHRTTNGDAIVEIHIRSIVTRQANKGEIIASLEQCALSSSNKLPRAEDRIAECLFVITYHKTKKKKNIRKKYIRFDAIEKFKDIAINSN